VAATVRRPTSPDAPTAPAPPRRTTDVTSQRRTDVAAIAVAVVAIALIAIAGLRVLDANADRTVEVRLAPAASFTHRIAAGCTGRASYSATTWRLSWGTDGWDREPAKAHWRLSANVISEAAGNATACAAN
jgi:hypothetical protein